MNQITRRQAMQLALGAGAMMTFAGASALFATETTTTAGAEKNVRLGLIGTGERGAALLRSALRLPGVEVAAICGARDYGRVLEREDIDAVLLGAPPDRLGTLVIEAFGARKIVGASTPAFRTVDDCRAVLAAQARHHGKFILLENFLYGPHVATVQRMAERGLFGELTYGYGALGPVCRWMGIDGARDVLQTLVAMGDGGADGRRILIRTRRGRLIEVGADTGYSLQGTRGAYDSARGLRHVYLEGRSPCDRWEPLDRYAEIQPAGHFAGDDDVRMMAAFVAAVRRGDAVASELEDAATWAAVEVLAEQSIRAGSRPVDVPNFSPGVIA